MKDEEQSKAREYKSGNVQRDKEGQRITIVKGQDTGADIYRISERGGRPGNG